MNYPAAIFRTLNGAWHLDSADQRVDSLAAELAACVATSRGPLCLGLIHNEVVPSFFGLVYLLDHYGLVLRKRRRQDGRGVFVFIERKREVASEYVGATVSERSPERPAETASTPAALPRAA